MATPEREGSGERTEGRESYEAARGRGQTDGGEEGLERRGDGRTRKLSVRKRTREGVRARGSCGRGDRGREREDG